MIRVRRLVPYFVLLALSLPELSLPAAAPSRSASAADTEFFEKQVRPVLANRCYKCHGNVKDVKAASR